MAKQGRPYFLIDTEAALEAGRGRSLTPIGALIAIAGLVLCDGVNIPADDDLAASALLKCGAAEWGAAKSELLESGDIVIVENSIVPSSAWIKPEVDS